MGESGPSRPKRTAHVVSRTRSAPAETIPQPLTPLPPEAIPPPPEAHPTSKLQMEDLMGLVRGTARARRPTDLEVEIETATASDPVEAIRTAAAARLAHTVKRTPVDSIPELTDEPDPVTAPVDVAFALGTGEQLAEPVPPPDRVPLQMPLPAPPLSAEPTSMSMPELMSESEIAAMAIPEPIALAPTTQARARGRFEWTKDVAFGFVLAVIVLALIAAVSAFL